MSDKTIAFVLGNTDENVVLATPASERTNPTLCIYHQSARIKIHSPAALEALKAAVEHALSRSK